MSSTRMLRLAAIAAVLASLGDLLLLYFANAQRPELGLPAIGSVWLLGGGVLGALAIPFYASATEPLRVSSPSRVQHRRASSPLRASPSA